jgi:aldehyde dehydrogenase (NAD+)
MTTMGTVTMGLSGQACVAHTRALVHRDVHDQFVAAAQMLAGAITYGDPFDAGVLASPLINVRQLDRVLGFVERAQEQGATLVTGGTRPDGDLAAGNFVRPTVFTAVRNDMEIARERSSGRCSRSSRSSPRTRRSAWPTTRSTGSAAGVYTTDARRAFRVARRLRSEPLASTGSSSNRTCRSAGSNSPGSAGRVAAARSRPTPN